MISSFGLLQIPAVLHIPASVHCIVVKREDLIGAMSNGAKHLRRGQRWLALTVFAPVAGLVRLPVTHPPR